MNRRRFVKSLAAFGACQVLSSASISFAFGEPSSRVNTVRGSLELQELGTTLMHEHVLVDFIGADKVSADRYNAEEVFRTALPFLTRIRRLGCRSLVECTPAYLGRDPALLRRLSAASGLNILTNTGYYGASNDKFVPKYAFSETAEQLASRWIREFQEGIDETGIKPGIIKIGVDQGSLSEIDAKLVRAAALTHLRTGLTIASHTQDGATALEELDLLSRDGVSASVFIWVHAHLEHDTEKQIQAARRGAWIEFDGIGVKSVERHVELIKMMIDAGLLPRTLISQDAGWYHVGEPSGGEYRPHETLFTLFVPALRRAGVDKRQIHQLLIENPRRALQTQIRKQTS